MAFDSLRKKLGDKYGSLEMEDPSDSEDIVPYDPEASTLMNLGRYAANNVAKGNPLMTAMPISSVTKVTAVLPKAEEAIFNPSNADHMARIKPFLMKRLPHSAEMGADMESGEVIHSLLSDPERVQNLLQEPAVKAAISEAGLLDPQMEALKKLIGQ